MKIVYAFLLALLSAQVVFCLHGTRCAYRITGSDTQDSSGCYNDLDVYNLAGAEFDDIDVQICWNFFNNDEDDQGRFTVDATYSFIVRDLGTFSVELEELTVAPNLVDDLTTNNLGDYHTGYTSDDDDLITTSGEYTSPTGDTASYFEIGAIVFDDVANDVDRFDQILVMDWEDDNVRCGLDLSDETDDTRGVCTYQVAGTQTGFLDNIDPFPPPDSGPSETDVDCFELLAYNVRGELIENLHVVDCLGALRITEGNSTGGDDDDDDQIELTSTAFFNFGDHEEEPNHTFVFQGFTSIQPIQSSSPFTHITASLNTDNNIISSSGAYDDEANVILRGLVNLDNFDDENQISFNCWFRVAWDDDKDCRDNISPASTLQSFLSWWF